MRKENIDHEHVALIEAKIRELHGARTTGRLIDSRIDPDDVITCIYILGIPVLRFPVRGAVEILGRYAIPLRGGQSVVKLTAHEYLNTLFKEACRILVGRGTLKSEENAAPFLESVVHA